MPACSSAPRSDDLEKPGRRDSGNARTSITRSTPALCNAAMNSGTVAPSYPMVKIRMGDTVVDRLDEPVFFAVHAPRVRGGGMVRLGRIKCRIARDPPRPFPELP